MENYVLEELNNLIDRSVSAKRLCEEKRYEECHRELGRVGRACGEIEQDINVIRIVGIQAPRTYEITEAERSTLSRLNSTLAQVERRIKKEMLSHITECGRRLKSGKDPFLWGYEIDVTVTYCIGEEDPAYSDDWDNAIAYHKFNLHGIDFERLADGNNYYNGFPVDMFRDREYHCWLFHWLYDHWLYDHSGSGVSWRDLLRISAVDIDIAVKYQNCLEIR